MPGVLVPSLCPFLCHLRLLLGLQFGVTVTLYFSLLEELVEEEPRGSPAFLRNHLVVKRKIQNQVEILLHLRSSDTSRGLPPNVMIHRAWKKNGSLGKTTLGVILARPLAFCSCWAFQSPISPAPSPHLPLPLCSPTLAWIPVCQCCPPQVWEPFASVLLSWLPSLHSLSWLLLLPLNCPTF